MNNIHCTSTLFIGGILMHYTACISLTSNMSLISQGNIHCPSCVASIESILQSYKEGDADPLQSVKHEKTPQKSRRNLARTFSQPLSVGPAFPVQETIPDIGVKPAEPAFTEIAVSIVDGTVSFKHDPAYNVKPAMVELERAGFEVTDYDGFGKIRRLSKQHFHHSSPWSILGPRHQRAHMETCVASRVEQHGRMWRAQGSIRTAETGAFEEAVGTEGAQQALEEIVLSITGMTCSSCTTSLERLLDPKIVPGLKSRTVLLVDETITIVFEPSHLAEASIIQSIEDSGYQVAAVSRKNTAGSVMADPSDKAVNTVAGRGSGTEKWAVLLSIEGMTCSSCTSAISSALAGRSDLSDLRVDLMSGSAAFIAGERDLAEIARQTIENLGYGCKIMKVEPIAETPSQHNHMGYRATFSIEGMTCSSCVNTITNTVRRLIGVSAFEVDLMAESASAMISDETVATSIEKEIEDLGYHCEVTEVMSVESHRSGDKEGGDDTGFKTRTVNVRIDGLFCEQCPDKVHLILEDLAQRYKMNYTPITLKHPVSTLTYIPRPPSFTLRTIRQTIMELGFTPTIIQSETLQDRTIRNQKRERQRLVVRLSFAIIFCIPTFIVGVMGPSLLSRNNSFRMWLEKPIWGNAARFKIILLFLATPVQFGVGSIFYSHAYKSIRAVWRRRFGQVSRRRIWIDRLLRWGSMDTLVALGTTIAWVSSLAYLLLDATSSGPSDEMGFFDVSVFLITFILAGRYLESLSKQKTGDALLELSKLRPKKGLLHHADSTTEEVEAVYVEQGDHILIPVGAASPVDGIMKSQSSLAAFDEASLTGESRPVGKKAGDVVYSATINAGPGAAIIEVTHNDGETVIESIAAGVRSAMAKKAHVERLADNITAIFVPIIVGIACLTMLIWVMRGYLDDLPAQWLSQGEGGWTLFALQFSVAVLVVACPCGIGLAAPTAQLVGVGIAARHGIMPNGGGEAFQAFSNIDAIIFDKTGTLTLGQFQVAAVETTGVCPLPLLWASLATVEQTSSHPIALAIDAHAKKKRDNSMGLPHVNDICEIPGKGMKAILSSNERTFEMSVGNLALMQDVRAIVPHQLDANLQTWQEQGMSVVLVSYKSDHSCDAAPEVAAAIAVVDAIRPEALFILQDLERQGIAAYIVSGDAKQTVLAVARQLHIPEDRAVGSASPEDKKIFIERLQSSLTLRERGWLGRHNSQVRRTLVAMVGDGVNDSIALAQADVSIALGGGSQVAASTAHFSLVGDSLLSILLLQGISRSTYRRIISNFLWACIYNVVLIPIAAGAFYDLGQTKLPAVWASLAMALSSISVVINSLLLRWTFRVPKTVRRYRSTSV